MHHNSENRNKPPLLTSFAWTAFIVTTLKVGYSEYVGRKQMKRVKYTVIFVLSIIALVGCSSTPSLNLNNEIWLGTATRQGNPDTFVRVTFGQKGKVVTGSLELGKTETTLEPIGELLGLLEGNSLSINTATNDTNISGTLSHDGKMFSGTLRFSEDGTDADFALTMTYQQEAPSIQ
jgi:hypothetical protein